MEKAKGIDVSHWQGRIDFDKVKSQGYSFVMINAGYGKYISQKDENFEKNYAAARKAGLNIGTYWYSYALTEADALSEAKTFLEAVKGKMFEYPLAFDIEDASQSELPNAAKQNYRSLLRLSRKQRLLCSCLQLRKLFQAQGIRLRKKPLRHLGGTL